MHREHKLQINATKNDEENEERSYTNVEDGSYIGVATVLIGSLLLRGKADATIRVFTVTRLQIVLVGE
jgi:hypothetical protein